MGRALRVAAGSAGERREGSIPGVVELKIGPNRLRNIVESFRKVPVTVVGDLVADRYVYGTAGRLSREAPVPIIDIEDEELRPGGAANTAANLAAMGAQVTVLGVVGDDRHGKQLLKTLQKLKIDTSGCVKSPARPTVSKTRVMAGDFHITRQQVIRLDRGQRSELDEAEAGQVAENLMKISKNSRAVALSDYGFGIAHPAVLSRLRELARRMPVVADSRFDLMRMEGVTAVTPNEPECEAALATRLNDEEQLAAAAGTLMRKLGVGCALITRGNKGMALFERRKKPLLIPIARDHDAVDVTGAGDTVVAAFTLALAVNASPAEAAHIANHAAGMSVLRSGAVAVTSDEILKSISAADELYS